MNLPFEKVSLSADETEAYGQALAELVCSSDSLPRFVAMYGDLGVGKTAFVRGFCSSLCRGASVRSPTFALVNQYKCSDEYRRVSKNVYHFDMYRISGEDDLYSIGFYDYLDSGDICIAEWCELIPFALPNSYIKVEISKLDFDSERNIKIEVV